VGPPGFPSAWVDTHHANEARDREASSPRMIISIFHTKILKNYRWYKGKGKGVTYAYHAVRSTYYVLIFAFGKKIESRGSAWALN
jgi:hypothetical protein